MVNLGEDQNGLQFEQTLLRGDNVFKFHRNFLSLLKTQPEKQVTNKFAGKARTILCPPPPSTQHTHSLFMWQQFQHCLQTRLTQPQLSDQQVSNRLCKDGDFKYLPCTLSPWGCTSNDQLKYQNFHVLIKLFSTFIYRKDSIQRPN